MKDIINEAYMQGLSISKVKRDYSFSMEHIHFHDSYEIYFLLEGERYYFIDKEIFHVNSGSLVLINREQLHKTSTGSNASHERIVLLLSASLFRSFFIDLGLPDPDLFFNTHYGIIELQKEDQQVAISIFSAIFDEIQKKNDRYELMVKLKVTELMILIHRYCKASISNDTSEKWKPVKHSKVQEIVEYLSEHYETNESLDKIAQKHYISKSYLCRIFREITGLTVNEYINLIRIKKAKRMLKSSQYSITEISVNLGYASITYFERVFKKLVGISPRTYQKQDRELNAL